MAPCLGLAMTAGFFLAAMALIFLALARFGSQALFLTARVLGGAAHGFLGGALALLGLADAGFGEHASARIHFFARQRAQHHAGARSVRALALLGTATLLSGPAALLLPAGTTLLLRCGRARCVRCGSGRSGGTGRGLSGGGRSLGPGSRRFHERCGSGNRRRSRGCRDGRLLGNGLNRLNRRGDRCRRCFHRARRWRSDRLGRPRGGRRLLRGDRGRRHGAGWRGHGRSLGNGRARRRGRRRRYRRRNRA